MNNFRPKSRYESERQIVRAQPSSTDDNTPFKEGAFPDIDGSRVPSKGVHIAKNYRVHPWGLLPRGGHKQWSDTLYPALTGYTGMALRKVGDIVIRDSGGSAFTSSLVGSFIVYDDGWHEKIIGFESADRLQVEFRTAHSASTAAYVRGPRNAYLSHQKSEQILLHIDTRLFYADAEDITSWTEIAKVGTSLSPANSRGQIKPYGDHAILGNSNGIFFIDLNSYTYFPINAAIPTTRITDVAKSTTKIYCRNYVYSMSRITGAGANGNRYTSGAELLCESGTNAPEDYRDNASVYTERPIGNGSTTYGKVTGGTLLTPYDVVDGWNEIEDGQFTVTMNGTERVCSCNFVGCNSMADVAARIQTGLRDFVYSAECEYNEDHFVITLPEESNTCGNVSAGPSGTDIGTSAMGCHDGYGTAATPYFTLPSTIGDLTVPTNQDTSLRDQHWTHYTLKGSLDAGVNGVDPVSGEGNNPQLLMWINDIPVAKAMIARVDLTILDTFSSGCVGDFVKGDEGCTVKFLDGTEVELDTYLTSKSMIITTSDDIPAQACCIGGGRIMVCSQSGTTVTRTSGDSFTSTDVGKPLFFATEEIRYVKSYTDANTVEVYTSGTIASTAATIDPVSRKWSDTLRDDFESDQEDLRSRVKTQYIAQNRGYIPLPDSELIEISPNKVFVRDENIVHYSSFDVSFRHLAGYHYEQKQREIVSHTINEMSVINDILTIKCNHETLGIDLNADQSESIEALGTAIIKCSSHYMIDEEKGVKYFSNLCNRGTGLQIVITAEPAIRFFDGREYGDNLAMDRIQKTLEQLEQLFSCWYDPVNGFTFCARKRLN